jgi:hypothetical protein
VPRSFKAIELDPGSRKRTGIEHVLEVETRQAAVDALLALLGLRYESARVDPTRTLIQVGSQLWTIVSASPPPPEVEPSPLRRAGAKHKRVR